MLESYNNNVQHKYQINFLINNTYEITLYLYNSIQFGRATSYHQKLMMIPHHSKVIQHLKNNV